MKSKYSILCIILLLFISSMATLNTKSMQSTSLPYNNNKNSPIISPKLSYSVSKLWECSLDPIASYDDDDYSDIVMSTEGEYIAISHQNNITVLHKSSNIPLWSFEAAEAIKCIALSGNGKYLAIGTGTSGEIDTGPGHIYLFNTNSKIPIWSNNTNNNVRGIRLSYDGFYICAIEWDSGSIDPYLYYFNKTSSIPMWKYTLASGFLNNKLCAMSWDGKYITLRLNDECFYFINFTSRTVEWSYDNTLSGGNTLEISMSANGDKIAVNFQDQKVFLFNNTATNPKLPEWTFEDGQSIDDIQLSSNGKYLVASTDMNIYSVYYFDVSTNITLWRYNTSSPIDIHPIAISGNGEYVISKYSPDVNVCLINKSIEENRTMWTGPPLGEKLKKVAISEDGRYILALNTTMGDQGINILLFYHDIPFSVVYKIDNDENNEDENISAISFGNYFIISMLLAFVSLILLKKKKIIFKKI